MSDAFGREAAGSLTAGMAVSPNVRLLAPLGSGGMGAVWLGEHAGLKTKVVVKFMLGGEATPSARARFAREAAAAAQVKSPHVVHMLDHGVTDGGLPFIVMEHLEGRDLGRVLAERGALPPAEVLAVVGQIGKALAKLHAVGLVHRDVKPENIFVCDGDDEVYVKLLDFGIVKKDLSASGPGEDTSLDGSTNTGQVVGTPFYMSPEQVTAQKVVDARSDLWALGVVGFQALTGSRPFDGPSFGALAVKIATGTPPRPTELDPRLPKEVDAWFAKACAREAADRFATARELVEGLRAALGGLGPPMSDSGQRALSASGRAGGDAKASSRPSPTFENASTLKSDGPSPQLGGTGSAVVDARASRGDAAPASRRRNHVVLGAVFAITSAAAAAGLSQGGPEPTTKSAPREAVPARTASSPTATNSALATAIPEPGDAAAVASATTASSAPAPLDAGARLTPGPRVRADAGLATAAPSVASASPRPSASTARPSLPPAGAHDDPLF